MPLVGVTKRKKKMSNALSSIPSAKRHSTQEFMLEGKPDARYLREGFALHPRAFCFFVVLGEEEAMPTPARGAGLRFCMQI